MRRPPRPLYALLGASLLLAIAWSFVIPPFHAPDEDEHYVYVQSLAENLSLPPGHAFDKPGPQFSPTIRLAERYAKTRLFWKPQQRRDVRPPWSVASERAFDRAFAKLPGADRGHVDSAANQVGDPPLYHGWEAIAYWIAPGSSPFGRLVVMRLWSSLLILLTVTGAWLLAGELFALNRTLQLAAAGCVGLEPTVTFMSSGVNPDAGGFAATAFLLWFGVRTLRHGLTRANLIGTLLALAAAALVKTALLTLAPAVVLVLLVAAHRRGMRPPGGWARALTAGGVLVVAVAAAVFATGHGPRFLSHGGSVGGFLSYLWQYYLPKLPSQTAIQGLPRHAFYSVWLRGSWAQFGWDEVVFPGFVYKVLAVVTVATFAGAAAALVRRRLAIDPAVLAFFAVAVVFLVMGLHVADYYAIKNWGGVLLQGRYLLPLLPIAGVALAAALVNVGPRWRLVATATVLAAMLVLNLASLGLVAGAFYV